MKTLLDCLGHPVLRSMLFIITCLLLVSVALTAKALTDDLILALEAGIGQSGDVRTW